MAEFQAGEVVVPVVPSAQNFIRDLKKQIVPGAYAVGQDIGKEIQRGISDQLKGVYEPLKEQTRRQQKQAPRDGSQIGGAFAQAFRKRLEAGLKALPKVELDADASAADQKVQELRARLATLSDQTIGVDIDAGSAQAELAAIQRELSAIDGKSVSIDVRTDIATALAELAAVEAGMQRVGGMVARPRVDVDISGALGAIGTISAALAGLAAIPVAATVGAGIAGLAAPLAAAGVGFAGLAAVAVPSISRIGESLKAQEQAQKAATSATSGAAGAAQQAQIQAINLAAAEQRVVDAKRAAKTAEEDLTRARQEAKRAAEDLARAVANAALDEESAALAVEEARQRLAEVQADPKAGELERKRAELDVRQAEQRAKDAQARNKRLQQDQKTADKAGIEGSSQVIAAKKKIEEANKRVEDSERQLRLMQLQQAAAARQSAAANKQVAGEVVKLSPAAAKLAKQWKSFSKVYEDWQKSLEPDILPVFGRGLKLVQSLLPKLSPLVRGVSVAVGGLLREMQKGLKDPFWQNFLSDLSAAAPKAIFGLGKSFGNIATGIAGVIKAFLPFVPTVVGGIEKATAAFAKWGKGLGESEGFKAFITYVQQNAPKVIQVVKNIWTVLTNLFSGLSGSGAGALDTVVSITDWLASLSPETLKTFALAALGVVAAFKTWSVISTAVDGVKKTVQTVSDVATGAKKVWGAIGDAATGAWDKAKKAAGGIATAAKAAGSATSKGATAVWTGIQSAATKSASVAKTAASGIATAARTAGSAAAKGSTVVWSGIQAAATRAGAAARVAGAAIAAGARVAGAVAAGLGRVALGYTKIAAQALLARTRVLLATAAQVAVKAATAAWTAVQWLLNAALNANPIGLIVLAIAALVAGLIYAYQNSETFRNIVDAVFKAIGAAATWLWETILKPAFDGLVALWQNVVGPAVTWLWNTIIKPAFDGIGALIKMVWENVIKPAFTAVSEFILNTLGPKFVWFHTTIVKPVMDKIGELIRWVWNSVIKPAFTAVSEFILNTLGPKFVWLHTTIVKPVMDKIGEIISYAWNNVIKPAFSALWTFITETIPNGFKKGVELVGKFWDGLKKVAAAPVEFVVNTVYNNGIAAVWNAVADALKLPKLPKLTFSGFARGGILPGTSSYRQGDDQLVAMRRGEGVYVSEAMRDPYERARLHAVNSAALSGKSLAPYQGFAGGGIIGDILANGVKWGAEQILDPILAKASSVMGDSPFAQMLVNIPKTLVAKVVAFLSEKEAAAGGAGAGKALEFARKQIGKPYEWGGTGPATFDCSGLTMRAWQAGGRGDIPRTSQQQMGWVKQVNKPVPGALGFPHPGHVWMYVNPSTIIEAPQTGLKIRQVAARSAQLIGVPPAKGEAAAYDSGGYLPTGHSLVYNGTGRPEPVLTDQQWQAIQGGAQGSDGPMLNIEQFHATPEQSPQAISRELYWLSKRPR